MIVLGVTGVMDHSGIRFSVWGFYDTTDHGKYIALDLLILIAKTRIYSKDYTELFKDHPIIYFVLHFLDSDMHHKKFECNYAFPFPHMDILHGTYDGIYLNKRYNCWEDKRKKQLSSQ